MLKLWKGHATHKNWAHEAFIVDKYLCLISMVGLPHVNILTAEISQLTVSFKMFVFWELGLRNRHSDCQVLATEKLWRTAGLEVPVAQGWSGMLPQMCVIEFGYFFSRPSFLRGEGAEILLRGWEPPIPLNESLIDPVISIITLHTFYLTTPLALSYIGSSPVDIRREEDDQETWLGDASMLCRGRGEGCCMVMTRERR